MQNFQLIKAPETIPNAEEKETAGSFTDLQARLNALRNG
jgi:hypothetical protein